jgi:hypothetical protein
MKRVVKVCLAATFVAFLHFASQIHYWSLLRHRFEGLWSPLHAKALVGALLAAGILLGSAALAARALARRRGSERLDVFLDSLFLLGVLSGVLGAAPAHVRYGHPVLTDVVWLVAVGAVGFAFARRWRWPARIAVRGCLLLSPLAFVACGLVLSWPRWDGSATTAAAQRPTGGKTPVVVLLFDGWSWPRSVEGDRFRPALSHLRTLAAQSVLCTQARSPAADPKQSVPRFLFQTGRRLVPEAGRITWAPSAAEPPQSLYGRAQQEGYATRFAGWGLPYHRLLGAQADACSCYGGALRGNGLPDAMAIALLRNVRNWSDPLSQYTRRPLRGRRLVHHARQAEQLLDLAGRALRNARPGTFAVFHSPFPAWPFLWNGNGTFRGSDSEGPGSPVGYRRNLQFLDHVVGRLMQQLRQSGQFDPALVLLAGTCSWQGDPEPAHRALQDSPRRVPLLIKLPGQRVARRIDAPLETHRLAPIFQAVLAGERDAKTLMAALSRAAASPFSR